MRVLQKILITCGMVVGLSLAVSAQKNDDHKKQTPPKNPNPPVINPAPPKKTPPPDSKKPKRPGEAMIVFKQREESNTA